MDFDKALTDTLESYKDKIKQLHNISDRLSKNEIEYKLELYNNSLIIVIYSLLQEGMTKHEEIKKKAS